MKITVDFIALTLSKGINTPLLLLETALIGRMLGPEGFGQWSLLLAAATLLHSVFINWTHSITLKFGSEEWLQNKSLNSTMITRLPLIVIGLLVILLLLKIQPGNWLQHFFYIKQDWAWLVLLNVLSLWLMLEAQATLQASGEFIGQAIVAPIITISSICFLLYLSYNNKTSDFIQVAIGVSLVKSISWGLVLMQRLKQAHFCWLMPSLNDIKKVFNFGWPLIPTFLLGYLSDWGDHVLLGLYCGSNDVGLWGSSYQIMLGIISLNSILVNILLPWLVKKQKTLEDTARLYLNNIIPALVSLWLLGVVVITALFPLIFYIFMGKQFQAANSILLILCVSILTNVYSSLYGILFVLQNRLKIALLYSLVMVIVNFLLSLCLIPLIGIAGAAIGTSISYLIGHMLYIWDQHRFMKVPINTIAVLFSVTLFIGFIQYIAGAELWIRLFCCLLSLGLLIVAIRKTGSIQLMFITRFFTGLLNPLGFFLKKLLVSTHANEHN